MNRVLFGAAALSAAMLSSACASGDGLGVAELSPLCAQQYQQASEHARGGGEQERATYIHHVSPNCRQEQERLESGRR
ncbi:hypothetical protein K4L06_02770 [Lysobacter sp. BMK333-48F3]|uniref:hypothetical protein n=1 Tax=Lysobacter sp. BMK333-48F3 TaxID=2867962 RepID=UPI001C8CAECC|nr:hypothetical protein [Lysobacter sp. BMK333-48F3]MBX9400217.1 hypothetical protein [Lysobacter sp. BMK333-48F3]